MPEPAAVPVLGLVNQTVSFHRLLVFLFTGLGFVLVFDSDTGRVNRSLYFSGTMFLFFH